MALLEKGNLGMLRNVILNGTAFTQLYIHVANCMGHTCTKKVFIYLKFKFNWVFFTFIG